MFQTIIFVAFGILLVKLNLTNIEKKIRQIYFKHYLPKELKDLRGELNLIANNNINNTNNIKWVIRRIFERKEIKM